MIRNKKSLFKKTIILTTMVYPVVVLSSCSSESDVVYESINDFLQNNSNFIVLSDEYKNKVLEYPPKLYFDNLESSLSYFELSKDFQDILIGKEANVKFELSKILDGTKIEFNIYVSVEDRVIEATSVIQGFKTWQTYSRESVNYLENLNLINDHKMKYNLKDFFKTFLSEKIINNEWMNLIDLKTPPGFVFEFNDDIKTTRYDSKNQKIVIGSFYELDKLESARELSISIGNNFKNANQPLYVFVVGDNGVEINSEDNSGINAEVLFIDRTSDNIIKFNSHWLGKAVFGEFDLSGFSNWKLLTKPGIETGYFQSNFITSVKLPKNVVEISDKMFYENKILVFDIPKIITKIYSQSFDESVKFKNMLSNNNLRLHLYYDSTTKTMDFANSKTPITELSDLLELLKLISRKDEFLVITKIILDASLFQVDSMFNLIQEINELPIKVSEVVFVSHENSFVNDDLNIGKWTTEKISISKTILSINTQGFIGHPNSGRIIDRQLSPDIVKLVIDGTLDLNIVIPEFPNYKDNLDYYFNTGDAKKNIVTTLRLENSLSPTDKNFGYIFKAPTTGTLNNIHISKETNLLTNSLVQIIGSKFNVVREMPVNLANKFIDGHLNLSSSTILVENFYTNIKYLPEAMTINKITLPSNIRKIPNRAFYDINLSKVDLSFLNNIYEVGDYAFYKSKLNGDLNMSDATHIGNYAFYGNSLTSLNIPKVTKIGISAFQENKLTSIVIPKVTVILQNTFFRNELTSVTLDNVTSVASGAFKLNYLTSVKFKDIPTITNTSFDLGVAIEISENSVSKFIPGLIDTTNKIIDFSKLNGTKYTFVDAINQINILFPTINNATQPIVDEVIWDLDLKLGLSLQFGQSKIKKIKKLTILEPKDITSERRLASSMFSGVEIDEVEGLNHVDIIGDYAFQNSHIKTFNGEDGKLTISKDLKTLGIRSFQNNDIKELVFETGSTIKLTDYSFYNNVLLKKVIIPNTIEFVSGSAFSDDKWKIIQRMPSKLQDLPWELKNGILVFNKFIVDPTSIKQNIERMNGLKIDKIKFSKDIYIIADNFMAGFKNANNSVEIDLSNILIINKNAFSGVVLEVSIGSYSGVIYNDISSGIVYNDIYSRIIYNNIDWYSFRNIDKFKEK